MLTKMPHQLHLKAEIQDFLQLALPLASAQVAQAATGFVDTLMMGHLGAESLAAGGLASTTFQFLLTTVSSVVMAVSPLVAEAYGAGCKAKIAQIARQGLWLSLLLSIPLMGLVNHLDALMSATGQAEMMVALAKSYLSFILWGIFPALGFAMLRGFVSALSQANAVMVIVIAGTMINITGNYVLGFGKFGFPRMELAGLGLASAFSFWMMFLALLVYTIRNQRTWGELLLQGLSQLKPRILWQIIKIGIPISVTIALEYGLFLVVTYLMGALSVETLAAHQTVYQTMYLLYMVPLGLSYASTVRVGQWLGQRDLRGARRAGYIGMASATVFMLLTAIALFVYPQRVIGLYIDIHNPADAIVLKLAVPMLLVAALSQLLDGVQKTAMGSLYGLQDTRIPMLLSFLSFWGIGLPTGYLLGFHFGFGGVGLWIGQSIGVAIAGIIFVWRFHRLTAPKTHFHQ
jgi:multidrug resistance protein, MATE family